MFFTIGHSRHALDAFVELLRRAGATAVVDVRTVPRSRANPQFNRDALPQALAGITAGARVVSGPLLTYPSADDKTARMRS